MYDTCEKNYYDFFSPRITPKKKKKFIVSRSVQFPQRLVRVNYY